MKKSTYLKAMWRRAVKSWTVNLAILLPILVSQFDSFRQFFGTYQGLVLACLMFFATRMRSIDREVRGRE